MNPLRALIMGANGFLGDRPRALCESGLFLPLVELILVLLLVGLSGWRLYAGEADRGFWFATLLLLLGAGGGLIALMLYRVHHHLMTPLKQMREWATRMRKGELSARIDLPKGSEFTGLALDINALGNQFERLSREMDEEVRQQTRRIEQKNRSLEILYDVAASINTARDLDNLLKRFLFTMAGVVNAHAACVRLVTEDGRLHIVASHGLDEELIQRDSLTPVGHGCTCGTAVESGTLSTTTMAECTRLNGREFFPDRNSEMIAVPLRYREKNLGVYNLFVDRPELVEREDIRELLITIGHHLGMAIEKARLDEESKRLTILQERNLLSHELHDSLAQTLASLRFQVRMLDDSLEHADTTTARREADQLKNGIDEAYTELRELLAHFRAPFDQRGLEAAIKGVVDRFRKETDVLIFFQNQWRIKNLPSTLEMQVLRIIQEALNNVRKHADAHAVRVLLRTGEDNTHTVLIEDDGVGIRGGAMEGSAGEHIGLSIMEERAKRLGGELRIESEPGEGTRVLLTFRHPTPGQQNLPGIA